MFFYDTCSLIDDYENIFKNISSSPFVISNITFKEIEEIKRSRFKDDDTKFKAREASKLLSIHYGEYTVVNYEKDWDDTYLRLNPILSNDNDSKITLCAWIYSEKHPDTIFVTSDTNCNNNARSLGVTTNNLFFDEEKDYTGYKVIQTSSEDELTEVYDKLYQGELFDLLEGQYLILKQGNKEVDSFVLKDNKLERVEYDYFDSKMFGLVKPLEMYQRIAMHSLRHNTVTMLRGSGGAGKSHLSVGYLFEQLEKDEIDRIIIFCNTVATRGSAKLGYYPGERTHKLLDSQIGNFLISKLGGDRIIVEQLINDGLLVLLPMSDIRGYDTSGMRAGVYITEAQNMDKDMLKLALQRIGKDSFCIIDGDNETQVDLELYSGSNNGMTRASKIFRGHDIYGEVRLPICHRSRVAAVAEDM